MGNKKEEIRDKRRMYGKTVTKVTIDGKVDHFEIDGKTYTKEQMEKFIDSYGEKFNSNWGMKETLIKRGQKKYGNSVDEFNRLSDLIKRGLNTQQCQEVANAIDKSEQAGKISISEANILMNRLYEINPKVS